MKLRMALIFTVLLGFLSAPAFAQPMFGVALGANIAKLHFSGADCTSSNGCEDQKNKTGFIGGVFVTAPLSDMFAIQPALLFSMKGGKETEDSSSKNKINYIEIPVLARIYLTKGMVKPFVAVGPSFGVRLSAKSSDGEDFKKDIKKGDVGISVGGGIQASDMIGIEARFTQSLTDIVNDTGHQEFFNNADIKTKNRVISILLDISIPR